MMNLIRTLTPKPVVRAYHFCLAYIAAAVYGFPSRRLRVMGVTGTNGKSSTVQLAGQLLMNLGLKVGWTTTASFRVGDKEWVNDKKMTMLGRFATQCLLRRMVQEKCAYALIETSSQGIEQFRDRGINYDTLVFTNLTPEHIEAHGGFEKYKVAKLSLFRRHGTSKGKTIDGRPIQKAVVVNVNDEHARDFAAFGVQDIMGFSRDDRPVHDVYTSRNIAATKIAYRADGTAMRVNDVPLHLPLVGPFYLENTLAAMAAVWACDVPFQDIVRAAEKLQPIPGRLETFSHRGATIIVDYAYEPFALRALFETIKLFSPKQIIHVTGSAGGGRDIARRAEIGRLAAAEDDIVIVTNEDPYDEDPWAIINTIADAAVRAGKVDGKNLFRILDRKEAIEKAIGLAEAGDVVLVTGKGSEPVMAVAGGKKIPSDDCAMVRAMIGS